MELGSSLEEGGAKKRPKLRWICENCCTPQPPALVRKDPPPAYTAHINAHTRHIRVCEVDRFRMSMFRMSMSSAQIYMSAADIVQQGVCSWTDDIIACMAHNVSRTTHVVCTRVLIHVPHSITSAGAPANRPHRRRKISDSPQLVDSRCPGIKSICAQIPPRTNLAVLL